MLDVTHTRVCVLSGIPAVFDTSLCRWRLTVSEHGSLRGRSVLQVGITSCFSSRKSYWDLMAKILRCVYLTVKVIVSMSRIKETLDLMYFQWVIGSERESKKK